MIDPVDLHLGRQLRHRRRLLRFTQHKVAAACEVRAQQIQKYECGANRIPAAQLWRLAQILEVHVAYFFEGLSRREGQASETAMRPGRSRRKWAASDGRLDEVRK
ncbi:MAG: helix-turn-helix domain-containing protein [Caulobacteraceae bacterium]